jgi:hypothetical protein
MKENSENIWLKNLPSHSPPEGMWEKIETRMDNALSNERLNAKLAGLPVHEAPLKLWSLIERSLVHRKFLRIGFITAGIAATLLLAFILRGLILPENATEQNVISKGNTPTVMRLPNTDNMIPAQKGMSTDSVQAGQKIKSNPEILPSSKNLTFKNKSTTTLHSIDFREDIPVLAGNRLLPGKTYDFLPMKQKVATGYLKEQSSLSLFIPQTVTSNAIPETDTLTAWLLDRNLKNNFPPPPSAVYPNKQKGASIGVIYLPEPMSKSDMGSSAYQTFALMAQYQMPSINFRTSLGISYQASPMEYTTDYRTINTGAGYTMDTIVSNGDTIIGTLVGLGDVSISGKQRSSFLYYSIGAGKRIYSSRRISTSLQVGAGFSYLLDNQNKLSDPSFYDAVLNQPNTYISNSESNIPVINQTHFDLVTGFDFNYRLHKRWSLSIEPTLKYYFNPIYKGSNSSSFSTGLRTGILFKL